MRRVIILRGIPGSGKSNYGRTLRAVAETEKETVSVFSADNFFTRSGPYKFDAKLLGVAHGECLRGFTSWVIAPGSLGVWNKARCQYNIIDELGIVDNTNTTIREMTTYVDLCKANTLAFQIVTIDTPPEIAAHRNIHGVPVEKVYQMHRRLLDAQIPKDWNHIVVPGVIV